MTLQDVAAHLNSPLKEMAPLRMIASASSLLIPLALTAGLGTATPSPSLHHEVRAFVTGYNTTPGQTDSTPCIAASGANICGRRDAVACPRRISLGTTVEIAGITYVCEDRLAKKFDDRFDISCDKDTACPPTVTGWATIKVYGEERPVAAIPAVAVTPAKPVIAANTPRPQSAVIKTASAAAHNEHILVFPGRAAAVLNSITGTAGTAAEPTSTVAHAPTTVAQRLAKLASIAKSDATTREHDAFVRRVALAAKASSGV
ncbi:MAG TPA: hypothetical protein VHU15_12725, partial [Stellaceae bacterium]|nr:hypothetical protein [Stellaceae bacterium]